MRTSSLSGGLLLAFWLLSFTAYAQVPLRNPRLASSTSVAPSASCPADYPLASAPHYAGSGHAGTYRLPGGSSHPAELFGPDLPDRVRLRPEGLTEYAVFWPGEVRGDPLVPGPAFVQRILVYFALCLTPPSPRPSTPSIPLPSRCGSSCN